MQPVLLDTDTLSEVIKGRHQQVNQRALQYLAVLGRFTFSVITRYEILRGLKAKSATRQIATFEQRCQESNILSLTDEIIVQATDIYADLYQRGQLISDADILIASTAIVHSLTLATENTVHFQRISHLTIVSWRDP